MHVNNTLSWKAKRLSACCANAFKCQKPSEKSTMFLRFTYDLRFLQTKTNDREKFSRRFQLKSRFSDVPCHEQPTAFSAF